MACTPGDTWLSGSRRYEDGWDNKAWAVVQLLTIRIQTPDPFLVSSCRYSGNILGKPATRMEGTVACESSGISQFVGHPRYGYFGTWEAEKH
jgi:hypothetical protein